MSWFQLSLILIPQVINGLKFPGPCPVVLPSDPFPSWGYSFDVVYIAPFSFQESHLFNNHIDDIQERVFCYGYILIIAEDHVEVIYGSPGRVQTTHLQNKKTTDIELSSLVTIDVHGKEVFQCHNPIYESVRIFYQFGEYVFVWSCREMRLNKTLFHDAALIYGVREYPTSNSEFKEMVLKFKSQARSFLITHYKI